MKWALALLVVCACVTRPPPAPPRTTKLELPIKHFELTNGLKVVLVEDPKATQVQVTMRYRVGGVDDPVGQEGMAHLVEHLMFQQVLGGQSLFAQLETIASAFNATTTLDATTFVSRARRDHLETLLSIEAVRVGFRCTSITDVVFDRERSVVINELRQRDLAVDTITALHEGTYPEQHPYRRAVAGTAETLGAITREQACAFADKHYTTKNAVLVVSGDVTAERLGKAVGFLARVAPRPAPARRVVPVISFTGNRTNVQGPVDDQVLVVSWALPRDPKERAQFRALAEFAKQSIDGNMKSKVSTIRLGDSAAPALGIAVTLADDETLEQVLRAVTESIEELPKELAALGKNMLGSVAYDQIRQSAAHRVFADFEDGSDRDVHLATDVLAGLDPRLALAGELAGLRALTKAEMIRIATDDLKMSRSSIVVLGPRTRGPRSEVELTPAVHDVGQHRDPPDPVIAHAPMGRDVGAPTIAMQTRTLANGLQVVLIPASNVPTVDIRLVFKTGAADDPQDRIGSAVIAARGLTFDWVHLNDLLLLAAAGSSPTVDIDDDHTEFIVRGMDMHVDALLAGLRRLVRDGWYGSTNTVVTSFRAQAKKSRDTDSLDDAWRTALFGGRHPYVKTGSARHINVDLGNTDAEAFRRDHYTPDNATIVISGGFDPDLANRWIDFLFADWRGKAVARSNPPTQFQPTSLARDEDGTLIALAIALPSSGRSRAEQLVLAEMLSRVAFEVREQLGASYDLAARLVESRLTTFYAVRGLVDAKRAAEAVELIQKRLEQLRADPDAAARAFARARETVAMRTAAITTSATTLSARVARDLALGRSPMSDLETSDAVRKLTFASIDVGALRLDGAAMMMRGPAAEIDRAYAVLGRTPTHVKPSKSIRFPDERARPIMNIERPPAMRSFALPLTHQGSRRPVQIMVGGGPSIGSANEVGIRGGSFVVDVGYRLMRRVMMGGQLVLGGLSGDDPRSSVITRAPLPTRIAPVGILATLQTWGDYVWGGLGFGLHSDRVTIGSSPSVRYTTPAMAFLLGVDVLHLGEHRLGLFGRIDTAPLTDVSFSAFTGGAAWRW